MADSANEDGKEPPELTAYEREAYAAITAAMEAEWPPGNYHPVYGAYHLPADKYPDIPSDPWERDRIYTKALRRAEWEGQNRARPVVGPIIEIDGNKDQPATETREAKFFEWLRALRDDGRIKGLGMAATVAAIGSRCQASTGALTFPPRKLAKDWCVSDQTIRSALKELESSGYIRRIDRGPGKVQHWQLTIPDSASEQSTESQGMAA